MTKMKYHELKKWREDHSRGYWTQKKHRKERDKMFLRLVFYAFVDEEITAKKFSRFLCGELIGGDFFESMLTAIKTWASERFLWLANRVEKLEWKLEEKK